MGNNSNCDKCKKEIKGTTYVCEQCPSSSNTYCYECCSIKNGVLYCPSNHKMG
jgi:hypothetical protein